ncbi:MAG: DUF6029 family protein [Candidatus Cloacimonetes bacterium]|nr:DUF6029 family protein [Candidatus Cloacimonadota bacterium]
MKLYILMALLLCLMLPLLSQNTLNINGLNEASFIYRTAEDSLNAYFSDTFGFNLGYRNFSFGMKFIADLPKYSTEQAELLDELDANRLELGWKEFYASYSKDAFTIHAGITEESFGNGIVFRSYKDLEFDEDHRLDSFLFRYDGDIKLKALYGAIESPANVGKYDIAYGADLQLPTIDGTYIGASAITFRNLNATQLYSEQSVIGTRMSLLFGNIDLQMETAISKDKPMTGADYNNGFALYGTLNYYGKALSLGTAYKKYSSFQYRLHDLPSVNHHNETLSDNSAAGEDEEGFQALVGYTIGENVSLNLDYAEAWDSNKDLTMNDAFIGVDWAKDGKLLGASYAHIEKLDDLQHLWQQELIPAVSLGIPIADRILQIQGEYKIVTKQKQATEIQHFEPKIQADFTVAKLSLSLGAQSNWEKASEALNSRYWASVEAKYPLASHSDIVVFAGKEAGGKVCRNGVCRYVAPFQGLKVELSTRF